MASHSAWAVILSCIVGVTAAWEPSLGQYSIPISCSPAAQINFNQGLLLCFNFNLAQARLSMAAAVQADPGCAMAQWGVSYANEPFINHPIITPPEQFTAAQTAAASAVHLATNASRTLTSKERGLITANGVRYSSFANQTVGYLAYRAAMLQLHDQLPEDPEVAAFAAESLMVIQCDSAGYHFYDTKGQPTADTKIATEVLSSVLTAHPLHPMAEHLWIHLTEPSASGSGPVSAGRAEAAADRLRATFNGTDSQHLSHMPAHTYLRIGRYNDAVVVNEEAHREDERYLNAGDVPYAPAHNTAFLVYAATMDGQADKAYEYSAVLRDIYRAAPDRGDGPGPEQGWNIALTSLLRFGEYQAVLDDDEPTPRVWPYSSVLRAHCRAFAYLNTGKLDLAAQENAAMLVAAKNVSADYSVLVKVAKLTVAAGFKLASWDAASAEALLGEVVAEQDSWAYDEPPSWHMPMRQCLGQVQLGRARFAQALQSFKKDLEQFPRNGFSLFGLAQAMAGLPDQYSADQVKKAQQVAQAAWERSTVPLAGSCFFFNFNATK